MKRTLILFLCIYFLAVYSVSAQEIEIDMSDVTIVALLLQTPIDGSEGMKNPAFVLWRIKDRIFNRNLYFEAAIMGNDLFALLGTSTPYGGWFSWDVKPTTSLFLADGAPSQYDHGDLLEEDQYLSTNVGLEAGVGFHAGDFKVRPSVKQVKYLYGQFKETGRDFVRPVDNWTTFLKLEMGWYDFELKDLNDVFEGFQVNIWGEKVYRDKWESWGSPGRWFPYQGLTDYERWGALVEGGFSIWGKEKDNLWLSASYGDSRDIGRIGLFQHGSAVPVRHTRQLHGYFFMEIWSERYAMGTLQYSAKVHPRVRLFLYSEALYMTYDKDISDDWERYLGFGAGIRVATWKGLPIKLVYGYGADAERPKTEAGHELFIMAIAAF